MNEGRMRWTDERLDDFAAHVDARFRAVEDVPERLIRLEAGLVQTRAVAQECNEGVKALTSTIESRREDERKERKTDRRWLIGTGLTSAGLVVAALALLADKL